MTIPVKSFLFDETLESIGHLNTGDIFISIDAYVNGGIGKQHSLRTIVIPREKYDPNSLKV
ncbi:hypothetical protein [Moritella sp. 28]|uniref:hypothetical protein n=1 Tax=Moritella sp. 28 TaxID=2746232 RepID=UPI001BAC1D3C|nr:hypothetical protein [Moritella sp. 28]QUM84507.1 hypothetical protein HWV02_08300 [Moritella sp. 28]